MPGDLFLRSAYGYPWMAGNCSCISGIPAIHGPPEIAPAFPAYRPSMAIKKEGPHWAGLLRVSFVESELREGPPTAGVIIRVVMAVTRERGRLRDKHGAGREAKSH
jgi:hypothetical protein